MCEAALADDLDAARAALAGGADVNARVTIERADAIGSFGYPPQAALAWAKSVAMMELLLAAGAEITSGVRRSEDPAVRTLVEEWPIRSATISKREQMLLRAARAGDLDGVQTWLRQGARATARDASGATAIDHARRGGHDAIAIELERAVVAGFAYAPLFEATLRDDLVQVRQLAETIDVATRNELGAWPLLLAARYRQHWSAQTLVQVGAKIDHHVLVAAIESGDLDGLDRLFWLGATLDDDPAAILAAACAQDDSDLLEKLLQRGLALSDVTPFTASPEAARLLREARAGRRPPAQPVALGWADCRRCRDAPDPELLERFGFEWRGVAKCPHCATYYAWDGEAPTRIEHAAALVALRACGSAPRLAREIEALAKRIEFDAMIAADASLVFASGEPERDQTRCVLIFRLSASGWTQQPGRRVSEPEHIALTAALAARGLAEAQTEWTCDFVWIARDGGVEVYDRQARVLEARGDRATLETGRVVARADITHVIAFAEEYVYRGVKAVLKDGSEVPFVTEASSAAMADYTYSRNELIFETGWCSTLGVAIATWAGVGFENLI